MRGGRRAGAERQPSQAAHARARERATTWQSGRRKPCGHRFAPCVGSPPRRTMGSAAAAAAAQEEEQVAGPNPPITYILADEGWTPLLEIIVQDAPPGAVIEVNTV